VMNRLLTDAGITDVTAESCGTAGWHVGEPMDQRTARVLSAGGYDPSRHRARQLDASWYDADLVLVMDRSNESDVLAALPPERHDRVEMFRRYDPEADPDAAAPDVPDPWHGGEQGFLEVLAIVERTCRRLLAELEQR
ncbi:MAG: low molecular weight protein-tyrosine-phosphatase, partial [Marmoricola sp.]